MSDYEYTEMRRVVYGEGATFVPVCEKCFKFVKADPELKTDSYGQPVGPNATCKKDGRVQMLFDWYY